MSNSVTDRNLLFGVLAFQMDFISREQLIQAMQAWVFDKNKTLGEILTAQRALEEDSRQLLEALVQKHLALHDNDAQKSLESVSSVTSVKQQLNVIADADLQASVTLVGAKKHDDPYLTIDPSAGALAPAGRPGLRFRILRPHARGGLGEVFVARDEELRREVALKEIQNRQADNINSRARFMLEAEITGGLEHPGIVPVYGLGTYADGRPYYAMRFIRGDSLKDAIDRFHKEDRAGMDPGLRAVEERRLLGRFIDVCDAIAYAHSRGVLHRDLKPGNIMLGKYGETLVVDWGLAKPLGSAPEPKGGPSEPGEGSLIPSSLSAGSATIAGSALGTPQYMSPEQAAGKIDQLGPAADVYSLGATLYCLLAGRPPIPDGKLGDILQKVQRGEITPLREAKPQVSPALAAICMKALALKPEDRYTSPRALAHDIEHWLADEPVSAWREPWTAHARRWISRHRTLVTGVSAAVLVALVGFVITTVLLTEANERERLAKLKAEENFKLAQDAVHRYHTEVSESVLLHEPGMAPLRRKLLGHARDYYDKFCQDRAGEPGLRGALGRATFRLAQITGDIDSELKAIDLHQEALKLLADLDGVEARTDLATCYHHLGRLYRLTDQIEKSEGAYTQALKTWDELITTERSDLLLAGRARSQLGLGNEYQLTRRLEDAREIYAESLSTRKNLAKKHPGGPEYQRELAVSHNNLAIVYKAVGKVDAAEAELRAALALQKKIADNEPHISQYQNDLARTYLNLGDLTGNDEALQEARRIHTALVKRHPDVAEFQTNLADTLVRVGLTYRAFDVEKAEEHVEEAVRIQRRLADKHLGVPNYQGQLGCGLLALGQVHLASGQLAKAEAAYDEAIRVLDPPVRALPRVTHYQSSLAECWNGLGLLRARTKHHDRANEAFRAALTLWEKLVKEHPGEVEFVEGESVTCHNLGNLMVARNDLKDAMPWYTRAQECCDAKKLKGATTAAIRQALANAHWKRAETLARLSRPAEALADWERALELAREPQKPLLRFLRAADLARAGKHAEAAKEADDLFKIVPRTGEYLYRFAAVYALAAGAADSDVAQSAEERKTMAEPLAAQALSLLNQARDAGFFKTPANVERLNHDPDLHWLRGQADFKKLGIEGPKQSN